MASAVDIVTLGNFEERMPRWDPSGSNHLYALVDMGRCVVLCAHTHSLAPNRVLDASRRSNLTSALPALVRWCFLIILTSCLATYKVMASASPCQISHHPMHAF